MLDTLNVKKGDHQVIRLGDIESPPGRPISTMDPPYTFDAVAYKDVTQGGGVAGTFTDVPGVILGQSQTATITFTANWAGTFRYFCEIHQPTMTGYLVVIG